MRAYLRARECYLMKEELVYAWRKQFLVTGDGEGTKDDTFYDILKNVKLRSSLSLNFFG